MGEDKTEETMKYVCGRCQFAYSFGQDREKLFPMSIGCLQPGCGGQMYPDGMDTRTNLGEDKQEESDSEFPKYRATYRCGKNGHVSTREFQNSEIVSQRIYCNCGSLAQRVDYSEVLENSPIVVVYECPDNHTSEIQYSAKEITPTMVDCLVPDCVFRAVMVARPIRGETEPRDVEHYRCDSCGALTGRIWADCPTPAYINCPSCGNADADLVIPKTDALIEPVVKIDNDPVSHPSHYTSHPSGIECIEVTRWMNFNLGNAVRHIWRAGLKNSVTELEDLKKAAWYIEDEIAKRENEREKKEA